MRKNKEKAKGWEFNEEKTNYANELLNSKEEKLNESVIRIPMKNFLQDNEELSKDLFTNYSQRELWNEVYEYCNKGFKNHAIVIGK